MKIKNCPCESGDASDVIKKIYGVKTNTARDDDWIPITDRLPDNGDNVLLWDGDFIEILLWFDRDQFESMYKNITHWMPLPAPPDTGEEE
jgi:hypothetical protein